MLPFQPQGRWGQMVLWQPSQGWLPTFPDSENACQVNPASSVMGTDSDLDSNPEGKELLSPFPM